MLKNALVLGAAAPLAGAWAATGGRAARALSSTQLAGQRVVYSYPGLTVPLALLDQISAGQAAGVIFFGENISGDVQIAAVIGQLARAQRHSPVSAPLLLMTDQEGGLVRRLPGAPAHLGYQGVTITDAIEAGALTSFGSSGQRAVLAAQAGMDLLLCSARDVTQGQEVTAALASALDSGRLNLAACHAAVQRVTALRSAL